MKLDNAEPFQRLEKSGDKSPAEQLKKAAGSPLGSEPDPLAIAAKSVK